ncbi:hypothetical protein Skr01_28330 [Sphaerisporangium krabiense]|uniref:SEFIR domain-containing protein n=1 Tax=Sphaerisporangium krabiense TaxID=763782 RepID=A0A7W8ZA82_9ACTN|nr:SEFIR domain-containing protein [Sphaerisporangium krabiense]MBB5630301.1 hypothetical protein [Sphaerisporangium krabiense]GII62748.1 hypothetical protein Skr01_28330 [Sphaerisporangium krabiense]
MDRSTAPRVFISYAHDSAAHLDTVRDLWVFLRTHGVDARLGLPPAGHAGDRRAWAEERIGESDFVLVVASKTYKERADGLVELDEVQRSDEAAEADESGAAEWEARHIRDAFRRDPGAAGKYLPVLLPGHSAAEIPEFLGSAARHQVTDLTARGADGLLRALVSPPGGGRSRSPLSHDLVLAVTVDDGRISCEVTLAGSLLGRQDAPLPFEPGVLSRALAAPPPVAEERLIEAGHRLCQALLTDDTARHLTRLLHDSRFGTVVDVVVEHGDAAAWPPYEALRLPGGAVLATLPGVHVRRRAPGAGRRTAPPPPLPGPLKILVAAAGENRARATRVVLDAVADLGASGAGEARVLEAATPGRIAGALRDGGYHVVHLSAPGTSSSVELEDEDGNPVTVPAGELAAVLRDGDGRSPFVVLSAGEDGATLAAALARHGGGRVLAVRAPVTDFYATALAKRFYATLATGAEAGPSAALAEARRHLEQGRIHRGQADPGDRLPPQYAVAALLSAGEDLPLVDLGDATPFRP